MATYYVTQAGGETINAETAISVADFNAAEYSAGDIIYICGTITTALTINDVGVIVRGDLSGYAGKVDMKNAAAQAASVTANSVRLTALEVTGTGTTAEYTSGIVVSGCAGVKIDNLSIHDCLNGGIEIGADGASTSGCVLIDNRISDMGAHGISVINSPSNRISSNAVTGTGAGIGAHGITVRPTRSSYTSGWTRVGETDVYHRTVAEPIYVYSYLNEYFLADAGETDAPAAKQWGYTGGDLYINIGADPATTTIVTTQGNTGGNQIVSNTVTGTVAFGGGEGHGIALDDGANGCLVVANVVSDNGGAGISLNFAHAPRLDGNLITGNATWGVRSSKACYAPTLNNNTCYGNGDDGIEVFTAGGDYSAGNVTLNNNLCVNNAAYGVDANPIVGSTNVMYGNANAWRYSGATSYSEADPQLTSDHYLGNATLETGGTWVAGVRLLDDLPQPLSPPVGAKCRRDWPGRRFGGGGSTL